MSLKESYTKAEKAVMRERAKLLLDYYLNPSVESPVHINCPLCYNEKENDNCRKCLWNYDKMENRYGRCSMWDLYIGNQRHSVAYGDYEEFRQSRIKALEKFLKEE